MTDDDLRVALDRAHADDHPPAFEATLAAARTVRPSRRVAMRVALAGGMVAGVLIALVMLWPRKQPAVRPDAIGMRTTTLQLPLDSLLVIPDQGLLSTAPDLTRGVLP